MSVQATPKIIYLPLPKPTYVSEELEALSKDSTFDPSNVIYGLGAIPIAVGKKGEPFCSSFWNYSILYLNQPQETSSSEDLLARPIFAECVIAHDGPEDAEIHLESDDSDEFPKEVSVHVVKENGALPSAKKTYVQFRLCLQDCAPRGSAQAEFKFIDSQNKSIPFLWRNIYFLSPKETSPKPIENPDLLPKGPTPVSSWECRSLSFGLHYGHNHILMLQVEHNGPENAEIQLAVDDAWNEKKQAVVRKIAVRIPKSTEVNTASSNNFRNSLIYIELKEEKYKSLWDKTPCEFDCVNYTTSMDNILSSE